MIFCEVRLSLGGKLGLQTVPVAAASAADCVSVVRAYLGLDTIAAKDCEPVETSAEAHYFWLTGAGWSAESAVRPGAWVIEHRSECDEFGGALVWANDTGWSGDGPEVFTTKEKRRLRLPLGGRWVAV